MKYKFMTPLLVIATVALCLVGCEPSQGGGQAQPPAPAADANQPSGQTPAVAVDKLLTRRNWYIVFDGSGSMQESRCAGNSSKVNVAKKAIKDFVQKLRPDDNVALLVFDANNTSERSALSSGDRTDFNRAVDDIRANGGTPLYEAIGAAFGKLKQQMDKQLNYGEYHLVVVTDGAAGDSENGLMEQIDRSPVVVHTIGFCIGEGHSLNRPGKTYYADAQSPADVNKGLEAALAESDKFSK